MEIKTLETSRIICKKACQYSSTYSIVDLQHAWLSIRDTAAAAAGAPTLPVEGFSAPPCLPFDALARHLPKNKKDEVNVLKVFFMLS